MEWIVVDLLLLDKDIPHLLQPILPIRLEHPNAEVLSVLSIRLDHKDLTILPLPVVVLQQMLEESLTARRHSGHLIVVEAIPEGIFLRPCVLRVRHRLVPNDFPLQLLNPNNTIPAICPVQEQYEVVLQRKILGSFNPILSLFLYSHFASTRKESVLQERQCSLDFYYF